MRTSKDCKIVHSDNNSFRLTLQTLILKYSMCFFAFRMEGQAELNVKGDMKETFGFQNCSNCCTFETS